MMSHHSPYAPPVCLPNLEIQQAAQARQDQLTKPRGSLGRLEDIAIRFAGWQGKVCPDVLQPAISVFAADHGVSVEGVSAYPAEITALMVSNFLAGGASINVLARQLNAPLQVIDVGVAHPIPQPAVCQHELIYARIRHGTANLRHQAAMSVNEALSAIHLGREAANRQIDLGANILLAGEMGIANTCASAALICYFTGHAPAEVVGRGTGIDDVTWQHKQQVVHDALSRVAMQPPLSPLAALAELGGLEIAAMVGFYLGAAQAKTPVLLDGFIATAAAIVADAMEPNSKYWWLASHRSQEQGHQLALNFLDLEPLLDLGLRLGEGSGAAICVPMLNLAIQLHNQMATFDQAAIPQS